VSADGKNLLGGMLKNHMEQRFSAAEACQHHWFAKTLKHKGDEDFGAVPVSVGHLKGYGKATQLEKASLSIIASQMSRQDIVQLEQAFLRMDVNGDGMLSLKELSEGLKNTGMVMDQREVKKLLEQIDTDGSGVIDYSEFIAATMEQKTYMKEETCRKAFQAFDTDGSGTIDRSELAKLLQRDDVRKSFHNSDGIEEMYRDLDKDGDGKIDFDEFMAMMNHRERTG